MRAIWIATVENIDWPSSRNLSVEDQKREMIELLDLTLQYNMNTIVLQIRPTTDALYNSPIEPWSMWLTGEQGKAPDPFYDPLEFTINECRKRGLDVHVWLNPYRAVRDTTKHVTSPDHITNTHPEWFVTYGTTKYFDPALPQTRNYISTVVADIVRRYDIDAIHMDDYFYPYRIANVDFPDNISFASYSRGFEANRREDWRRENVDLVIKQLQDSIKSVKPWVEFGISPFGVWRNADKDPLGSKTRAGQTNYDDLYADILKWQKEGWIDYVVPQLYWHIGFTVADYTVLAQWWSDNAFGTQLYIGQAPYRISPEAKEESWRTSKEIVKQVEVNRAYHNIQGSMYFSAKFMRSNPLNIKEELLSSIYQYPALVPTNNRIKPILPDTPYNTFFQTKKRSITLTWDKGSDTKSFVIYRFNKKEGVDLEDPSRIIMVTSDTYLELPIKKREGPKKFHYLVTAQSQTNTESEAVYFKPFKEKELIAKQK
jgi:uncharacterized lipoprotein YddW (UPF0748 family)